MVHRADDLIPEEDEIVQQALKRLSPKEAYDRVFRMRRAFQVHPTHSPAMAEKDWNTGQDTNATAPQCSLSHQLLPQNEWTKSNDVRSHPPSRRCQCITKIA